MILIIDGYNLLFNAHWPVQGISLEERRAHLIKEIAQYRSLTHLKRVIIVFDGKQDATVPFQQHVSSAGIEIYYAVCDGKADEKILSLCEELSDVQLVTADRRLARAAKSLKSRIWSPEEFIQGWYEIKAKQSKETQESSKPVAEPQIAEWLKLFGLNAEIEFSEDQIPESFLHLKKKKKRK